MPFTPFHFGPGGALHAAAPRQVSFLAFAGANILMDLEPAYFMFVDEDPLHRFLHTYVGALLVAAVTAGLFLLGIRLAKSLRLPSLLGWQQLLPRPVLLGATAGSLSHIVLDSIMHFDIRPLAPFSQANPIYGIVSIDLLHVICIIAGVLAIGTIAARLVRKLP